MSSVLEKCKKNLSQTLTHSLSNHPLTKEPEESGYDITNNSVRFKSQMGVEVYVEVACSRISSVGRALNYRAEDSGFDPWGPIITRGLKMTEK